MHKVEGTILTVEKKPHVLVHQYTYILVSKFEFFIISPKENP